MPWLVKDGNHSRILLMELSEPQMASSEIPEGRKVSAIIIITWVPMSPKVPESVGSRSMYRPRVWLVWLPVESLDH